MQQVWDKNGNVYFVDEQGQKVNNSLGNWQKAINKGRAAVANIENWINETNPNSDAYKQKVSLISALTTAPAGMGSFATNALAKGFTPFMGRKIAQAAAQGFGGGLVGGAVEGGVDSALNGENIALGALKGAAIGAPSGLAGGYAIGKLGQGIVRTGLKNGTTNKEQYFNDYVADLNNQSKAMQDFRLAQTGGNKGASYGLDNFIGESAFNINRADLNNAKLMKNQGYMPTEIFDKTGWFQGVDEKWRTEIPYGELNENPDLTKWQDIYLPEITEYSGKIGDIYNAPALYKNYPFIKDMDVYFKDTPENIGGYFDGNSITVDKKILPIKNPEYSQRIKELEATPEFEKYKPFLEDYNEAAEMEFLNSKVGEEWADLQFDSVENMPQFLQKGDPRKLKEVLTHELQHKIQDYENFARGASANSPHYWSSAGEIEARKVGHRSNYPEHLLEEWKPFESHSLYDIAPEKQIVEYDKPRLNNFYEKLSDNTVDLTNNFDKTPTIQEVKSHIKDLIESGKVFDTLDDDWKIDVRGNTAKIDHIAKSSQYGKMNKSKRNRHNKYVMSLENIINNSKYTNNPKQNTKLDKKPNIDTYHYFETKVKIGDKKYKVILNAEQYKGENTIKPQTVHLYDVIEVK